VHVFVDGQDEPSEGGGGGGVRVAQFKFRPALGRIRTCQGGLGVWLWVLDISDFGSVNVLLYLYAAHIPSTKSILSQDY